MQYRFLTIFVFFSIVPDFAFCDQVIQYEPVVVELSGTVHQGKFQHPNGQWVRYSFIKLKVPVGIKADQGNEIGISFGRTRHTIAVIVPIAEYKRIKERKLGTLAGKVQVEFRDDWKMSDEEFLHS